MSRLTESLNLNLTYRPKRALRWLYVSGLLSGGHVRLVATILMGVAVGMAVIISTHYVENAKLLVGLLGGIVFVQLIMRWPEFGILCYVALLSGLISLSWLPGLHLGPISLTITDMILLLLLGLVFLRLTTKPGFKLFGSPLVLPLFLFLGAVLLSAINGILIAGVGFNEVLRTVRMLILWILFIPTLQLVRDEQALRRLLTGLVLFAGVLLVGVVFPNKFEPFLYIEERQAGTGAEVYSDLNRFYYAGDMILYAMIPVTVASLAMVKKGNQIWRIGFLCMLLYWLFKTFFRTYWLTVFVICGLLTVFLTGKERIRLLKRLMPVILIGVILLVILIAVRPSRLDRIVYIITDRLGSLLQDPINQESSLKWRMIETRYALLQIGRHPIFGIGLANAYRPPMEFEASSMYGTWAAKYLENGYLYIAVMMGLVGLVPFLWLCAAYLQRVIRHYSEIQDDLLRAFYLGFGAAFLGQMVCNITSPNFVIHTRLVFFPFTMAICELLLLLERKRKSSQPHPEVKIVVPTNPEH